MDRCSDATNVVVTNGRSGRNPSLGHQAVERVPCSLWHGITPLGSPSAAAVVVGFRLHGRALLELGTAPSRTRLRPLRTAKSLALSAVPAHVEASAEKALRQANGIVAGLAGMPWRRFLVFNALGAAIWVGTWSAVGYLAGNHLDAIYAQVKRYELYLLIALAVQVIAFIVRHLLRRRRQPEQGEEPR